ncbi:MAG: hypothetical protein JOY59_07940 [Candidatus Eremiobacteraeota bacterium]|nr:hypothetical protein [Candidatus Eremiobacteraeota bacterium]
MSVAAELYDRALATGARSVVVIGTAKNVGKTTTVQALLREAERRRARVGITSLGRDGEAFDAVDGRPKPRLSVEPGTLVAAGYALLPPRRAIEILGQGEESALGPIVIYRTKMPLFVEISGPPTARGVRATIERLHAFGAFPAIVDGAVDRVAAAIGGEDAVILATGAALADSEEAVVRQTASVVESLRERAPNIRLVACTCAPVDGDVAFDALGFTRAIARATGLPAFDVHAGIGVR